MTDSTGSGGEPSGTNNPPSLRPAGPPPVGKFMPGSAPVMPFSSGSMPPPPMGFGNGVGPGFGPGMHMPPPPPLPPNWSEHRAPNGSPYYFNNLTKQSTYTRPLPGMAMPMPPLVPGRAGPSPVAAPAPEASGGKKKDKPKEKIPIPGTTWLKVITSDNKVFYTEKTSKKSSWTVPEDIKEEIAALEAEQRAERLRKEEEERLRREEEREAQEKERERIRKELLEERKRLLEQQRKQQEEEEEKRKRKQAVDQQDGDRPNKITKTGNQNGNGANGSEDHDDLPANGPGSANGEGEASDNDEGQAAPEDEDDEEAWQRAVAAELAAEHAEEEKQKKEAKQRQLEDEEAAKQSVFQAPVKVDLSAEEGKALFKALLHEKNISPFAPWETSLPLFINDPRYILLSSEQARRDTYEEYCREAARARRQGKNAGAAAVKEVDPEQAYTDLLRSEVKSTRMLWDDFRRAWKKDRRFFGYGKDDKQKEKAFRRWQRELGERKRLDAEKAERDFMDLLKENKGIKPDSDWREVKRSMTSDPRYDAVGSSSLREELFNKYRRSLKAQPSLHRDTGEHEEDPEARRARQRKERAEASLREREAKVRQEKERMEAQMRRSKMGASREEGERDFGSLLIQAVREHTASWAELLPQLEKDPRFDQPGLSMADKHRLFTAHLDSLARKRLDAVHQLFESHAPSLDTPFDEVYPEIVEEWAVKRLNLSHENLENKYNNWQRVRSVKAREDFQNLLGENSFIDFWGRMRNKTLDENLLKNMPEEDEDMMIDDEEAGGRASLLEMAKQVDLREMHAVLEHDKRYRMFDHMPEEREKWMRDYLSTLAAAKATVHGAKR